MSGSRVTSSLNISEIEFALDNKDHELLDSRSSLGDCFGLRELDRLLNAGEGRLHKYIRVYKNGRELTVPSNFRYRNETQKNFVKMAYQDGGTVFVDELEERSAELGEVCRHLETRWGGEVSAKGFLTPAHQEGFPVHFDVTPSIVIQLDGSKTWSLYKKVIEHPTQLMNRSLARDELELLETITLKKGDVLCIAAGVPHEAACTNEHSFHVALSLDLWKPTQLIDYANKILTEKMGELRRPLYLSRKAELNELVKQALKRYCEELTDLDIDEVVGGFEKSFNANRYDAENLALTDLSLVPQINQDSLINRNSNKMVVSEAVNGALRLYPSGTMRPRKSLATTAAHITFPAVASQEIEHALNLTVPIPVKDLPGKLDVASKILITKELVKYGILAIV